ncbi:MAG: DNA replication/repair protein RecF [Gammaproteobacteria bacterium]|nr:DNA replication/repair protein RecF [Gammaproteobacteria bacterium]MDH3857757.1 DNA replication/repair protein RecF [Gammaproteobacteria bacterium]
MAISQLSLTDFRNLQSTTLDFDPRLNLISGANGSGKTSLLEAIFVLCQAHSFRTHQLKQCIQHGKAGFLLFGRFNGYKAGLAKNDRKLEIRIDGETVRKRSELVRRSPVNIANADIIQLIEGSPQQRRAFLDWCLFHVEPDYAEYWRQYRHALKQRNHLLKSRKNPELLDYWDQHLLEPSRNISKMRNQYCADLGKILLTELGKILSGLSLELNYHQGWPQHRDLADALGDHRERDIRSGFTSIGIHRDDIDLTSDGRKVSEFVSRGQGKRLCLALLLAVLKLVSEKQEKRIILLIDDLHSELDHEAQKLAYGQLAEMDLQLFISNIDSVVPGPIKAKEFKLFHVEHGTIKPQKSS